MAGISLEQRHKNAVMRSEIAAMKFEEAQVAQAVKMFEHLPSFAVDEDENDWIISRGNENIAYTEQQLDSQVKQARTWERRPSGRNILQTMQDFIIGKCAEITADDQNPEVQEYWKDWQKANNFDMKSKEIVKRCIRDGEDFLRWFPPKNTDGHLQLRFIDPLQIKAPSGSAKPTFGIETDPDDYEEIIGYHRQFTNQNNALISQTLKPEEIDHIKIGVDSDVKRGVSFFIGIGQFMQFYDQWLKDRINLNRIRSIFNVVGEPVSGVQPISDLKNKLADTTVSPLTGKDSKKQATRSGSVLFTRGIKWKLDSLKINANDTKEDGRNIQLMIAIGTSFPEYITRGDASNSNFASTMVSESPFVRAMESWQDFFAKVFKKIFVRVIEDGMARGKLVETFENVTMVFDPETGVDSEAKETLPTSTECTVNFAELIHRELEKDTKAVQIHVAEKWVSNKTASAKFGYEWDSEQEQIARETAAEEAEAKRRGEEFGVPDDDSGEADDDQF